MGTFFTYADPYRQANVRVYVGNHHAESEQINLGLSPLIFPSDGISGGLVYLRDIPGSIDARDIIHVRDDHATHGSPDDR